MTDDAFHLTALDARRYDFGNALRGYDRARVDLFREQVAEELERLSRANQELEVKARNFHEQLRAFRERDKALNDALISAQQLRGEIREQAQREAQLIIREAQGDAERSLEALRGEIRRAEDDLQQLWRNRRSYVQQLRQLMERQVHDLDSAEMVPPPVGLANIELAREPMRETTKAAARENETPRDQPRAVSARETAASVERAPQPEPQRAPQPEPQRAPQPELQRAPQPEPQRAPQPVFEQRAAQQPWARVAPAAEQAPPVVQPLMQPVPHPLPPMSTQPVAAHPIIDTGIPPVAPSPHSVPPLKTRQSLPTPSWLDVVEGE